MSLRSVLDDDWSDYEDIKKRAHKDVTEFICSESWEIQYLMRKIIQYHPDLAMVEVKNVIGGCCRMIEGTSPREEFVTIVMERLGIHNSGESIY